MRRARSIIKSTAAGRVVFDRLLQTADVLIANMPPAALKKLSLDYASLSGLQSNLILTTINAYGPEGPFADAIGFDGTGQALSGGQSLTGTPDQPFRSAVSYVDYATAMAAALATVAALLRRERTGQGEHVQCSLLGTALTMTNPMLIEEATGARSRIATGNRSPIAGPSDLFRTTDGWVMIQVIGQAMFRRWTELMNQPDLVDDPRFSDDVARGENGEELSAITARWTSARTTADCIELVRAHRLPATPLLTPAETLEAPEVLAGRFLSSVARAGGGGTVPLVAPPFRFGSDSCGPPPPAPTLGSDTSALLRDLAIPEDLVAQLTRDGAIGGMLR